MREFPRSATNPVTRIEKKEAIHGAGEVGEYSHCVVNGTTVTAPKRYTILEAVGHGSYGFVCSAHDKELDEIVAIKKVEDAFVHFTHAKSTLREIKILRHLRHENILRMRLVYVPDGVDDYKDVYIVTELMDTNLRAVLIGKQTLTDDHNQFLVYQLLRGLLFIHSADVVHRDLKPSNLLVDIMCELKICDFGAARIKYEKQAQSHQLCPMTEYVVTRWYRAPEVLCSWVDVGKPLDIWSVGCIFGEMLRGQFLFPGASAQHQLQLITACIGKPHKDVLRKMQNVKCRRLCEALPSKVKTPLEQLVPSASPEALDNLRNMLRFDPESRLTVQPALESPYFERLHCPEDEPTRRPLKVSDFEFERRKIDMHSLREEIYTEGLRYDDKKKKAHKLDRKQKGKVYNIADYPMLEPGESQYDTDEDSEEAPGPNPDQVKYGARPTVDHEEPEKMRYHSQEESNLVAANAKTGDTRYITNLPFESDDVGDTDGDADDRRDDRRGMVADGRASKESVSSVQRLKALSRSTDLTRTTTSSRQTKTQVVPMILRRRIASNNVA